MKVHFQIFGDSLFLSLDGLRQPTGWTESILRDHERLKGSTSSTSSLFNSCVPASGVKAYFFEDEATGIQNLNANLNTNEGVLYDLSGRKMTNVQKKGVYNKSVRISKGLTLV